MPTVGNKHKGARRVFYQKFDGGLNLSASPETISMNELRDALNVEISNTTGKLKVRGGLHFREQLAIASCDSVDEIIPIEGSEDFLIYTAKHELFYYKNGIFYSTSLGSFSPSVKNIKAVMWDDVVLLAYGYSIEKIFKSGDRYDCVSVPGSPANCRFIFVHNGRVGVVDGDSTIRFSAVGDYTRWENDPDDDSSGQWVNIGYKDGMTITAIAKLSKDVVIFKAPSEAIGEGTIWRLVGAFPDWQVVEAVHDSSTYSYKTIQLVGNDIFYITESGLATLSTVMEYGDIKMKWVDRKVAQAITELITSNSQLWHIPSKSQLWLMPSEEDEKVWVFDYAHSAWTYFEFPELPKYVLDREKAIFVFIGNCIYELYDNYYQDEMVHIGAQTINAHIRLKLLSVPYQILVKAAFASYSTIQSCRAGLYLGKFTMPLKYLGANNFIYDDTDIAYEDTDFLWDEDADLSTARRRCIVRGWRISPEIKISGGGFELSSVGFEIVEV